MHEIVSATKIGKNITNIFHNKFTLNHIKPNIYIQKTIYRKLNLSLTSSIFSSSYVQKFKKRLKQTKVYHTFCYFVLKETTYKPLKVASAKNLFSSVYVLVQLASMNVFILCDNRRTLLFMKLYRNAEILLSAMLLLSLSQCLGEVRILCVISTLTI